MGAEHVDYHATHRSLIVDIEPFVTSPALPGNLDSFIQAGLRNPVTFLYLSRGMLRFEWLLRPDDDTKEFEQLHRVYEFLAAVVPAERISDSPRGRLSVAGRRS